VTLEDAPWAAPLCPSGAFHRLVHEAVKSDVAQSRYNGAKAFWKQGAPGMARSAEAAAGWPMDRANAIDTQ